MSRPATTSMRVRPAWAIVLLLVAALEFVASFAGFAAPAALVLAVLLPFALIRVGQVARAGTMFAAFVVVLLAAGGAWLTLHASSSGLGDALPRLLTTRRPAPASAALLVPPTLLVALVATVCAAKVLAPFEGRPDERRSRGAGLVVPVVGAAVLYAAAQVLAAGAADPHGIVAVCLLAIAVGGWTVPYLRGDGHTAWRPAAVVPLAVAVVVGLGVATLSGPAAFDPRRHVTPPTIHLHEANPLGQLGSWSANPSAPILTVRVHGASRLHLATLDTFGGDTWQVDSRYRELGVAGPGDLPAGAQHARARATVRIIRLAGVWLPAPGTVTASSLGDLLADPDDGTLARAQHARPGLTYDVRATINTPSGARLAAASVPASVPARYLDLPQHPVAFARYARAAVRGASTPLEEAVALENAVATNRRLDPKAPSGSSYGRLSTFLFGPRGTAGAQTGTDEQFAAAFAVLGREVGLPTRLTVGFVLPSAADGKTVTVRGRDASVWPEVYLGTAGWTPFAPTPGSDGGADKGLRNRVLDRLAQQAQTKPPPDPPVAPPVGSTGATPAHARPAATSAAADDGLPTWAIWTLVVVGALVLLLGLPLLLRVRRTRRHRRHGPRGAWAEIVDLLVLLGRRPSAGRPAPEIAADARGVFGPSGAPLAAAIAQAADRAAFAPEHANSKDVWRDVRVLRRRARSTLPRHRRLLLPVDPRPLLRR